MNEEVEALAREYFAALNIPEKAKIDAFHLAVAAWHKMDYVLSWNCKHIANAKIPPRIHEALTAVGPFADPLLDGSACGRWQPISRRWAGP